MVAKLCGVSLAVAPGEACYILAAIAGAMACRFDFSQAQDGGTERSCRWRKPMVLAALKPLLEDDQHPRRWGRT